MSPSIDLPGQNPVTWPEKPSFTRTCTLLSQYMKEKGSFGDLKMGINGSPASTKTTMNLFPQHAGFSFPAFKRVKTEQPHTAQMTIFYAGKVIVLNDFPEEKAKEIMKIAAQGKLRRNNSSPTNMAGIGPPAVDSSTGNVFPTFCNETRHCSFQHGPSRQNICHLPIARRASLHRFLEKRKERITTRAPYPPSAKSWLGLAAHSPE